MIRRLLETVRVGLGLVHTPFVCAVCGEGLEARCTVEDWRIHRGTELSQTHVISLASGVMPEYYFPTFRMYVQHAAQRLKRWARYRAEHRAHGSAVRSSLKVRAKIGYDAQAIPFGITSFHEVGILFWSFLCGSSLIENANVTGSWLVAVADVTITDSEAGFMA